MTITQSEGWLVLVLTLSGAQGAARIRVWRSLRAAGAAAIRDGVHVLPAREGMEALLREQQREITGLGGTALLFCVPEVDESDAPALRALFDRSEEYAKFAQALLEFDESLPSRPETEARRLLRQLKRELQNIEALDFFPSAAQARVRSVLMETEARMIETFSPGEPIAERRAIPILKIEDYKGKRWATRRRPWVDRIASAWFIRRFINPCASFVWLNTTSDCPKDAIGFDYDGAAFTHVGDLVTFEVLIASFNLGHDKALHRLGTMIHGLDTGTPSIPEAAGFETLLNGAREMFDDDDALVTHASHTLDFLYAAFTRELASKEHSANERS